MIKVRCTIQSLAVKGAVPNIVLYVAECPIEVLPD